jgi:hypothetical protein
MAVRSAHTHDNEPGKAPAILTPQGRREVLPVENHEESVRRWRAGAIFTGIITVLSLIVMALWGASLSTADDGPIGEVPDDIRALIADPPEYDCVASATKYELPTEEVDGETKVVLTYIPNEVGTAEDQRDTSDSVNVSALPAERDRFLASVCSQPEEAGMVGFALATEQMVGNEKLADLNPNLFGQFVNSTPKEWADKVFSGEISYADATETMTQLAGLVTIFEVTEETRATEWNFHALDAITTEANVRPIVKNDTQYTGDFLVFSLTRKGVTGCWSSFGINIGLNGDITKGDQRIVGFICETPTTPTTPPTTPPEEPECTDCDESGKDPTKSTLNNPEVDDWKKDGGDEHGVNEGESTELQENPREDAEEAEEVAEEETAEVEETHEDAVNETEEVNDEVTETGDDESAGW